MRDKSAPLEFNLGLPLLVFPEFFVFVVPRQLIEENILAFHLRRAALVLRSYLGIKCAPL